MSREVGLVGVELAPFAGAHNLAGIRDRGRPVKALAECVANEGAGRGVMATDPRVDVPQELAPLGDGDTPLQDAGGGALVQLTVDEGEGLGHPRDASGLGPVRGELPSSHPSDILVAPISLDRSWLDIHHIGFVGATPLEEGEYVRLVRGVLVHGLRACWIQGSPRGFCVARGVRLEDDGGLGDITGENVRWDGDPPGRDLGQLVRLLVVPAGHMIELGVVKLVLEGSHGLAVCFHLVVMAIRILHDLVNHELRIPPHVEALDAYLDGDLEAAKEGLVLSHVV
jgi:hypothetical protein